MIHGNARLRDALLCCDLTTAEVAAKLGVDRKTVERWVGLGRIPYPQSRRQLSVLLGRSEAYLWPEALTPGQQTSALEAELVRVYPHRASVPGELWQQLLASAAERVEILVYAGIWLPDQNPRLADLLNRKARDGVEVRILLGDPDSSDVARRGAEEGIGDAMAGKVRNVLVHYAALAGAPNVEVRLHSTTLYTSIYRFDDHLLANSHVFGFPAAHAPVLHVRRLPTGSLFETYSDSFDKVWATARSAWPVPERI
ncbi:MAG: helix-turn-helix domain-containing protein [Sporichthyaceae bacterium]